MKKKEKIRRESEGEAIIAIKIIKSSRMDQFIH